MEAMDDLARRLEQLADKYRTLAELRARREQREAEGWTRFSDDEGRQRGAAFRRVAARFPGALRELHSSPAAVLAAKASAVEAELAELRAGGGAPARPWIAVVLDFHATLAEALAVKMWLARRLGRAQPISDEVVAEYCRARAATVDAGARQ